MKIAVFASGNGSNFQALVDYFRENKLPDTFEWLFCDQPNAFVLERAEKLHVPFHFFHQKNFHLKENMKKKF